MAFNGDLCPVPIYFDRLAREGVLFQNAFCLVPSCTPARGVMLTGRPMHALGEGANLWSTLPPRQTVTSPGKFFPRYSLPRNECTQRTPTPAGCAAIAPI